MSAPETDVAQFPQLSSYVNRYFEIQNSTFNATSPLYTSRVPSNGSTSSTVWLYFSETSDRWQLADSYNTFDTIIIAYSELTDSQSTSSPPSSSTWTFVDGNVAINNVSFMCTCECNVM